MLETITLDGRRFHPVSQALTANQDDYVIAHLRLSGAMDVLSELDGVKRTPAKRAEDLLTRIYLSGRTYYILAGLVTEDGKVWSRGDADANAARFAGITDATEKTVMRSSIVTFVINFFMSGEPLSKTSQKSSSRSARVPPTENAAPTSETSHR